MKTSYNFLRAVFTFIAILSLSLSAFQVQPQPALAQGGDGIQRDYNAESGKVTRITGKGDEPLSVMGAMSTDMTPAERSDVLVQTFAPEFGLTSPSKELTLADESQPETDRVVTKYQQVYNGVPVLGGELIVNASDQGELYSMNGELSQGLSLDTNPAISVETAIDIAKQGMTKWYGGEKADYQHTEATLYIFDESILRPSFRPAELAWKVEMVPVNQGEPIRELVLVSAKSGNIPLHFNQVDTGWQDTQSEPVIQPQDVTPPPAETPVPTPTPLPPEPTQPEQSVTVQGDVSAQGATWYVATTGNDANNCSTTTTPCKSIQAAINKASTGDLIKVSEGTYTHPTINANPNVVIIDRGVTISGGWVNSFADQTGISIIDGQTVNNGILVTAPASVTIEKFIVQNSISSDSGAIYHLGTSLTLRNSTLKNNSAGRGAGIYVTNSATLIVINSTISNNNATIAGGGIYIFSGTVNIEYSTIAYNTAPTGSGGGVYRNNTNIILNVHNTILANNSAPNSANCNGLSSSDYNIFDSVVGCSFVAGDNDQVNIDPEISSSLQGLSSVHLPLVNSPAIDAGDPISCASNAGNQDERSVSRPQGPGCDIGSVEYALTPGGNIFVSNGSNQKAGTERYFSINLSTVVRDFNENPVSGVTVTFTAPTSGASGTFANTGTHTSTAVTDINGIATAPIFTANSIYGVYNASAVASGYNGTANFQLANVRSWFVSPTGVDSNACDTSSAPCLTFQKAIDNASSGEYVNIAAGTYTTTGAGNIPVASITKNLDIFGGWNNSFTTQNGFSTVDGQNTRQGFSIWTNDLSGQVSINRFVIKNGKTNPYYTYHGGGIIVRDSALSINNLLIQNNNAEGYGGGISAMDSNIVINNTTITGNTAGWNGGGIFFRGDASTPSTININNSTIVYNSATSSSTSYGGGGIYFDDWGSLPNNRIIRNSILAFNTASEGANCKTPNHYPTTSSHNIIYNVSSCGFSGGGYISSDPQITETLVGSPGHYALIGNNPAIDAGDPSTCLSTDQRGIARPQGSTCDIGAFERALSGNSPSLFGISNGNNQRVIPGQSLPINLSVYALDNSGDAISGLTVTFTAPVSGASGTFANTGTNTASVITNTQGIATSPVFTTNNIVGSYTITAQATGLSTLLFQETNIVWYVSQTGGNTCTESNPHCTSINEALNSVTSGDTIWVEKGIYQENVHIVKDLTIKGGWNSAFTIQDGQSIIDGEHLRQNVKIDGGVAASMNRFDVRNGNLVNGNGGGILNSGSLTFTNGAIYNNTVHGVVITGTAPNTTKISSDGGGVYSNGTQLTLENVTISNNEADTGGGVFINSGTTSLNNVTITQNLSTNVGVTAYGGGIENKNNSPITIKNSIIAGNAAEVGQDCYNAITSGGNNLIGYSSGCDITLALGDLIGDDNPLQVKLGDLANNGGNTYTHALLTSSPAIDAGNPATCAATDQRGVARPQGAACDMGAFEGSTTQPITANIRTYSAENALKWPGTFLCDESQASCTNGLDPAADTAHLLAIDVYDFNLSNFNRLGIDENNMPVISTVHYCTATTCPFPNAFWSGAQMIYGDGYGFANADDIVAHELTHGVTQYESNLFYFYQSGAINESFSDLFGEYYDQNNGLGTDTADVKWIIGEDVTGIINPAPKPPTGFRSMVNPPIFGDPDKMTSTLYKKTTDDSGGVHSNSGVNNKAVYLMVDGGTFNNKTVTGIGWDKTAAIYYEANTNLLTSGSDYSDLYYALQQACANLTGGAKGITSADCVQVKNALDAVQMNSQPTGNFNPDATLCPPGMTTSPTVNIFNEDFENGISDWNIYGDWKVDRSFASGDSYAMWGDDEPRSNDSTLAIKNGVALPAGTTPFLHFKHAFAFEYDSKGYYDGGVLEYTKDNGSTWLDAKLLFSSGRNYTGTVFKYPAGYQSYGSALQGRSAFVGDSHGYVSSRYDLKSLAGQTVKFRWRFSTDYIGYYLGWFVDDVSIYQCVGTPTIPVLQLPANNALTTDYTPKLDWADAAPAIHHYQVQVATDKNFAVLVYDENNLPTSDFTVPSDLTPNTTYYWRVRSFNAIDGTLGWTAYRTFRTALTPPTLVSPTDPFASKELRPMFDWNDVPTATGYTIQIAKDTQFKQIVHTGNPVGSFYTPAVDLLKNATLYWRVLTKGANGPSAYSGYRSFTTPVNPPPMPVLLTPASNFLSTDTTPTFTWKPVVMPSGTFFQNYILQVDDSADFSSPVVNDNTVVTTTFTPGDDLATNTKFYWRVRAVNTSGEMSNWSTVRTLRAAILPPTVVAPADGAAGISKTPLLDWSDVPGNSGYVLQVYKAGATPTLVKSVTLATNVSQYQFLTSLLPNTSYFWKVQTKGANGPSSWSEHFDFTTGP